MLTQERLKELLHYCPETGIFTWKQGSRGFSLGLTVAGGSHCNGYLWISIDNKRYMSHRLAFLYMEGELPKSEVDHINRIKCDNRWANLRVATRPGNQANVALRIDNTSGHKGVCWHKGAKKWFATIKENGKQLYLGTHDTVELAAAAYNEAAKRIHGEFSYCGDNK